MLTEHSVGIYSTKPPPSNYKRRPYEEYEKEGGWSLPTNMYALSPNGKGRILSWTVRYKRKPNEPLCGVVMGEMVSGSDQGKRFCATTYDGDTTAIEWLLSGDRVGEIVLVQCDGKKHKVKKVGSIFKCYFITESRGLSKM